MEQSVTQVPTPEQIAQLAYLIWEREGRPLGCDTAHWLQAEEQLWADYRADAGLLDQITAELPIIAKARQPRQQVAHPATETAPHDRRPRRH